MYSQWMPQNLQKRLLLYILQQLSLFSEIDLPNLEEVSLSNIHLKDVAIDPEKVGKIPGFKLRYGKLASIDLSGGVVGGVMFEVLGAELVVAPHVESFDDDVKNAQILLAQSRADLAKTVLLDDEDDSDLDVNQDRIPVRRRSSRTASTSSNSSAKRKLALGGMMSRAIEIALLRLQVRVSDLTIKLISDSVDVSLHVDEISFKGINGARNVKISGIRASTTKPHVNAGHSPQEPEPSESEESEDSDADDYGDDLNSSMVYTHEEASSMYMSATAQSFTKPASTEAVLLTVSDISIDFEGLSPISNFRIDVGILSVAAVPVLPTISLLCSSITKALKLKVHSLKKRNSRRDRRNSATVSSEDNDYDLDEELEGESHSTWFESLHVSKLEVSFTSALNALGSFESKNDDLNICLENVIVKRKDENLYYGGVDVVKIFRFLQGEETPCFEFESPRVNLEQSEPSSFLKHADIRFEMFKNAPNERFDTEFTVLASKKARVTITPDTLMYLVNFGNAAGSVFEVYSGLMKSFHSLRELASTEQVASTATSELLNLQLLVQTALISVSFDLTHGSRLSAVIFPVTYSKMENRLTLQKVLILTEFKGAQNQILNLSKISLNLNLTDYKMFVQRNPKAAEISVLAQSHFTIDVVSGSVPLPILKKLKSLFGVAFGTFDLLRKVNFLESTFNSPTEKFRPTASVVLSSIYTSQRRFRAPNTTMPDRAQFDSPSRDSAQIRITVNMADVEVTDVSKGFGILKILILDVDFSKSTFGVRGLVRGINVERAFGEQIIDPLLHTYTSRETPLVLLEHSSTEKKSTTEIHLYGIAVEFYTHWLQLFENEVSHGHNAEEIVHSTPTVVPESNSKSEMRIVVHDLAIGLSPGRLPSKLALIANSGTLEFTLNKDQFYIKSSFQELRFLLADDVRKLKESARGSTQSEILQGRGFLAVGRINATHVGITINTDIKRVKKRNEALHIQGDLALVDVKVNSDEQRLDVCADSFYTLIQTFGDLKIPVTFTDEDKFHVKPDSEFHMPLDVFEILAEAKQSNQPSVGDSLRDSVLNLSITDDYHDHPILDVQADEGSNNPILGNSLESESAVSDFSVVEDHFTVMKSKSNVGILPFKLHVNLSRIKLFFYDGYDWKLTRKSLRKAVKNLEDRAQTANDERPSNEEEVQGLPVPVEVAKEATAVTFAKSVKSPSPKDNDVIDDEEHESQDDNIPELRDTLFESIYLAIPEGTSTSRFIDNINSQLQFSSDPEDDPSAQALVNVKIEKHFKDLKLHRSRAHKVLLDIRLLELSVLNHTSRDPRNDPTPKDLDFEVLNQIELRIDNITAYDNVPTSTWNTILTYMSILGVREVGTSMVDLTIANVRPDPDLAFAEARISVKLLPLRLHLDQDTLGFITRFFAFKDARFALPADEVIFIEKFVMDKLHFKFDYKPKKVDYMGIRSGNNAELVNFFVLDGSEISLKKVVLYGIHGMPNLGEALKNVYTPYIRKYQIAGLLSGLPSVKSVINLGSGVRDLIVVPTQQYKKDGHLIRSLQKGTHSFLKTTSYELLKLGVKLASGTQVLLENLEEYFGGEGKVARAPVGKDKKTRTQNKGRPNSRPNSQDYALLEDSQLLTGGFLLKTDSAGNSKAFYGGILEDVNEEDSEEDQSILVLGEPAEVDEDDENGESDGDKPRPKALSLYSGQPRNTREGLKSAYSLIGKNFKTTKKKFRSLRKELQEAESLQDQVVSIAKSSPVLVIRPMIGTTEAVMKTLMGVSNEVDSKYVTENIDKYGALGEGKG